MNIENLSRRIDKLLEHVHQQLPAAPEPMALALHLFTEQEQTQLQALLDQVEPKYCYHDTGRLLRNLSESELDQLELWAHLEQALQQEDIQSAATYRRMLQQNDAA